MVGAVAGGDWVLDTRQVRGVVEVVHCCRVGAGSHADGVEKDLVIARECSRPLIDHVRDRLDRLVQGHNGAPCLRCAGADVTHEPVRFPVAQEEGDIGEAVAVAMT